MTDREFWLAMRNSILMELAALKRAGLTGLNAERYRALRMQVRAIERRYEIEPAEEVTPDR